MFYFLKPSKKVEVHIVPITATTTEKSRILLIIKHLPLYSCSHHPRAPTPR